MTQTDLAMPSTADEKRALRGRMMAGYDGPTSLTEMVQLAAILARSRGGMVPPVYYNNPDAVVATFLACRALDVAVWTGLHELYSVKGVVGKKAILVRGLWLRHGVDYEFEATDTECTGWIKRPWDEKKIHGEYSLMDAQRLGLIERNPEWEKQPKAMLRARWTTMMASMWTPNIVLGMNLDETSADPADDEGGWSTENTIGPEVLRVLDEAGIAMKKGEGIEGLRRVWDQNLVLLDAWAGEGETLRQVLTKYLTDEATKGLPDQGRQHPGDAGGAKVLETGSGEPRIVKGETVEKKQDQDHVQPPADGGGMWGPEESAAARLIRSAQQPKHAEAEMIPVMSVVGDLVCGCPLAGVMDGTGHRKSCTLNGA